ALAGRFGLAWGGLAEAAEAIPLAGLVVNATAAGLSGASPLPPQARFRPGAWAYDLVYRPRETPFMAQARAGGARPVGGLGMLVRQAARTWTLFFGETLPEASVAAAERALEESL
ncbi:MAG: shikimate dehydrogenase, partial [Elusimicrobia bacterium]|nr:shikimate dehydrogenase [Elusimicrobiota bacterium]